MLKGEETWHLCREQTDRMDLVSEITSHSGSIFIEFETNLDRDGPYSESWGIKK